MVGVARRQDQHGRRRSLRAKAPQHIESVELGQGEIENDQIESLVAKQRIGRHAVVDAIDGVSHLAQRKDEHFREGEIVLHDQQSHDFLLKG